MTFEKWREKCPIRQWRKKNKISQMKMASMVGTTIGVVLDWESGRLWPRWFNFERLAEVMKRNPATLENTMRRWWLQSPERREVVA